MNNFHMTTYRCFFVTFIFVFIPVAVFVGHYFWFLKKSTNRVILDKDALI